MDIKTEVRAKEALERVFGLLETHGSEAYHGEPVSQLEHMLQAGELAGSEGADEETVLAAFLHDIGHLCAHLMPVRDMGGYGVEDHEAVGAAYLLEQGFSTRLCKLVGSHVAAKRYLAGWEPGYMERLSEASMKTLEWQGGPMSEAEAEAFTSDPDFTVFLRLRDWDDRAKVPGALLPDLSYFRELAWRHLTRTI